MIICHQQQGLPEGKRCLSTKRMNMTAAQKTILVEFYPQVHQRPGHYGGGDYSLVLLDSYIREGWRITSREKMKGGDGGLQFLVTIEKGM